MCHVPLVRVMKEVKIGMGRIGVRFPKEEREWRLPGLLYEDNLVQGGESEEGRRVVIGYFVETCK